MLKWEKEIKDNKLFRVHGFALLMPLVNSFKGNWVDAQETIVTLISNHIEQKYEKITVKTGIAIPKKEWKKAFGDIIKRDFFKLGYDREQRCLEYLKKTFKSIVWENGVSQEFEKQGIDIIGRSLNVEVAVSVKGFAFKSRKNEMFRLKKHLKEFSEKNNIDKIYIAFVSDDKLEFVKLRKEV